MKMFLSMLVAVTLAAVLSGCENLTATGPIGTKTYPVRDFEALRIGSNMTADIRLGNQFGVTATGVERDLNDLRVVASKGRLTIDYPVWYQHRKAMHLLIMMPVLRAVDLSGSVRATLTGSTETPAFGVDLSGTSRFEGTIRTGQLTANINGDTGLRLAGQATRLIADASGTTNIYAFGLQTDHSRLNLTGQSYAEVSVMKQLAVQASGQSRVRYRGTPQTDLQTSGQSRVERD